MRALAARAAGLFLAPAVTVTALTQAPPRFAPPRPPAGGRAPDVGRCGLAAVVLAKPDDLSAVAGSAAARLRGRGVAPVVCVWDPAAGEEPQDPVEGGSGSIALPAAGRAARRLADHGLEATARGALAWVSLGADSGSALAQVRRAERAAAGPVLVALAARDPRMDALVAECGRVVVALPEDCVAGIADLAVAELEALSRTVERVAPPAGAIARAEARLGLR